VFIVAVYFDIDSVRKLLDTLPYITNSIQILLLLAFLNFSFAI